LANNTLAARAWAAALALSIHNAEEIALGLPGWAEAHPQTAGFNWSAGSNAFMFTAVLLMGAAFLSALMAQLSPRRWMGAWLKVVAVVMLVNAASHLALSVYTGSLMPGVVSAFLVLLPVFGWIALARRDT
jgi:hypothetical protein